MDKNDSFYDECLKTFTDITQKPTQFLQANEGLTDKTKKNLKNIYDFSKKTQRKRPKSSALSKLIVDNFDLEQIWQQLELQNNEFITRGLIDVSKFVTAKNTLLFKPLQETDENGEENDSSGHGEGSESNEEINESNREDEASMKDIDEENEDYSNKSSDGDESNDEMNEKTQDFFNKSEMERFLEAEEQRDKQTKTRHDSESDSGSEIDMFASDNESDEDKVAKYKDFFGASDMGDTNRRRQDDNDESSEDDQEQQPSSFEQRQERLKRRIEEIEEEAVEDKPWQLKGEITGDGRPQNSMLEEIVEFDLTTRPAPVMTEQTTMQLEDIIKQRVKDKVFDSVVRKAKPVETALEYKKKLVLDQEKSKESLAQIYEKEFLAQQAALDPENDETDKPEPQLHQEIDSMMRTLFAKLDSLSNFHFTPKPAMPELKIISNLPAISMEEVAPVALSDAALLAPEEVKAKSRGELVGITERTSTDKNRERRKKKLKQKVHKKRIEILGKKPPKGDQLLKKLAKGKNVQKMSETSSGGVKSSRAFFTQLEEAKSQIYRKSDASAKKKIKNVSVNAPSVVLRNKVSRV